MASRRSFIAGMLATGLAPKPTWADAGGPAFLTAGMKPDGTYVLCGLSRKGQINFELPLPSRGHAAAAHPTRPEAVAFARRPGTYAIVLDCTEGRETARLEAPVGRHFYGHGCFTADGDYLFTTENDFEAAQGVVGVWKTRRGYSRVGEFASGGVGPHDIRLMPDGNTLVVANGGIETHPDTGRAKLNISTMRSNLTYMSLDGQIVDQVELGDHSSKNSIRHLAVSIGGTIAFAMQWQGDLTENLPLLGIHDRGSGRLHYAAHASVRRMRGYLGSVALSADGKSIATTSPRAGLVQEFNELELVSETPLPDVCGVAWSTDGFVVTAGNGEIRPLAGQAEAYAFVWDNHLVAI